MSPPSSTDAPLSVTLRVLSETMRSEMRGNLTQKVPPKPQHTFASRISVTVRPSTLASSARG